MSNDSIPSRSVLVAQIRKAMERIQLDRQLDEEQRRKQMLHAEQRAAYWLYLGNRAQERGDHALAQRHYNRAQRWHDEMVKLDENLH